MASHSDDAVNDEPKAEVIDQHSPTANNADKPNEVSSKTFESTNALSVQISSSDGVNSPSCLVSVLAVDSHTQGETSSPQEPFRNVEPVESELPKDAEPPLEPRLQADTPPSGDAESVSQISEPVGELPSNLALQSANSVSNESTESEDASLLRQLVAPAVAELIAPGEAAPSDPVAPDVIESEEPVYPAVAGLTAETVLEEDMEDGELSDEDNEQPQTTSSTEGVTAESQGDVSLSTNSSSTDQTKSASMMSPPPVPSKRSRKSTESSDEPGDKVKSKDSSDSSSSEDEESRSERKRKRKEKERRKKEKKQKRKREKQERKKRKRQRMNDDFVESSPRPYGSPDGYEDSRWEGSMRSPPSMRQRSGDGRYDDYGGFGGDRSPAGPYDSPGQDPYASPPCDSSDDEFAETLYSIVGDELMDPNVSAAERELIFKKSQERIPGLSAGKLKKIMKQRHFREQQARQRQRERRRPGDMPTREKSQKCRYYAEGKCQKGERCQFSHNFIPAKKMEACKFFLQGYCAKGDMCIYLHSEVPCRYFHTGQKCYNAEKCKFSHEALTDSTRPLLEKAILLEETGTFKSERPSLLGSPPKSRNNEGGDRDLDPHRVQSFDPEDDKDRQEGMRNRPPTGRPTSRIPSILDLDILPSVEMQHKLDAGLYEELTAPLSDSEDDRYDSPPKRPQSFYSDTLATPDRPDNNAYNPDNQRLGSPNNSRRNRWGPDLPNRTPEDQYNNQHPGRDFHRNGGGDADRMHPKKGPLLPIPNKSAPFAPSASPGSHSSAAAGGDITSSTAQAAAVSLSKILNALRSNAVAATSRVSDPRAAGDPRAAMDPRATVDPRVSVDPRATLGPRATMDPRAVDPRVSVGPRATIDPRAAVDPRAVVDPRGAMDPRVRSADPRAHPAVLLPDPRNHGVDPAYDQRLDHGDMLISSAEKAALLPAPVRITPIHRPIPEINGKYTHPIEFKLIPVYVEIRTSYIPPGAENSQEMLRDPRIKKRVLSMKKEGPPALPSLPDITADLQRIQNARQLTNSAPIAATSRLSSRTSIDSLNADPRRNSVENKYPYRGQGDQNSNNESIIENGNKPRNATRTALSKVNPMSSGSSYSANSISSNPPSTYDDEEDEDNTLTIDMPEDESKTNRAVEAAYT